MKEYYTEKTHFYGSTSPKELIENYGTPLYIYNEAILRERCREMTALIDYPNFKVNYSTKANSNLYLLKIIREEGLHADAMSPGEIHVLLAAGFKPQEILFISNNVSKQEMQFAIERDITVSVDSISQLIQYGKLNPGGKVAVRFNPGVGAGHHEKVVTGGKKTKFGVNLDMIQQVKNIVKEYDLKLIGINQHIGSLFMEVDPYIDGVKSILDTARQFDGLEFIDMGGGFGIPYFKQDGQKRLNLKELGEKLSSLLTRWADHYGSAISFKIEPGRYIVAECGVLLGTVHAVKYNFGTRYIGTDLGFNVLARPVMYDSHHDIEVYKKSSQVQSQLCNTQQVTIVGNICENGDIIAKNRSLPPIEEGDLIGVMDAGAYGYSMSSNYNNRLRPAEVLIQINGNPALIRKRDTLEDLMRNFN